MIKVLSLVLLMSCCSSITSTIYNSYATHFDGIGSPYGGCGLPESALPTTNYVALNVQNTPGDYTTYLTRPITVPSEVGLFDNGLNCGRWVRVTIGDNCVGVGNSGAPGSGFCKGGTWVSDKYNGAVLDFIVTDSCQDGNEWCRDTPHLDLHTSSLASFVINGQLVGNNFLATSFNNRQISWQFIPTPQYAGDIWIGWAQGAEPLYYLAISISNLPNGLHGVQSLINNQWQDATMVSDLGQLYLLPSGSSSSTYTIRIIDASEVTSHAYRFSFPSSCGAKCSSPWTRVSYTTGAFAEVDATADEPSTLPETTIIGICAGVVVFVVILVVGIIVIKRWKTNPIEIV